MDGYKIVISARPNHPYERRLNAYLVSPNGTNAILRGFNHCHGDAFTIKTDRADEKAIRKRIERDWPGFHVYRDDDHYVPGVDPVPGT